MAAQLRSRSDELTDTFDSDEDCPDPKGDLCVTGKLSTH
jgi:hypothetical protein